jgi:hypothetical protein
MTASKEKTFLDWLLGSNEGREAQARLQVGDLQLRMEELQREMESERASVVGELEAVRVSRADADSARVRCQAELELANAERLAAQTALESAQTEIARLTRLAAEARAASTRDAESSRKVSVRCSSLQFELDKLRSVLEAHSKREIELQQALLSQRAAHEESESAIAAHQAELLDQGERIRELEDAAARAISELGEREATARTQLDASQAELEQRQRELSVARADTERLQKEFKRQQASFIQASGRQQASLEAERRAWAAWLGQIWNTLSYTLGPAAPLAFETCLGEPEPVAHAATTEAAQARLQEFLAVRSLCRSVAIVGERSELRLELTPAPALEGTEAGWVGILATRQLAAMLRRPLRTRRIEQADALLTVHTTSRSASAEGAAVAVEEAAATL